MNFNLSKKEIYKTIKSNFEEDEFYDMCDNDHGIVDKKKVYKYFYKGIKKILNFEHDLFFDQQPINIIDHFNYINISSYTGEEDNIINEMTNALNVINAISSCRDRTSDNNEVIHDILIDLINKHINNCYKIREFMSTILCKDVIGVIYSYMLM